MRNRLLISAAFFFSLLFGTNVSGVISSNTTWSLANSPYNIIGDVGISAHLQGNLEEALHFYQEALKIQRSYQEENIGPAIANVAFLLLHFGQENTARMKLKEKISRRIYPIEIIEGSVANNDVIKINNIEIGKIINNSKYSFGLFKFKDPNFKLDEILDTDKAKIKVKKPFWLNS